MLLSLQVEHFVREHLYLDARVADETLKKVVWHSDATAFANIVFPVPGGPNKSIPCNQIKLARKLLGAQQAYECQPLILAWPATAARVGNGATASPIRG